MIVVLKYGFDILFESWKREYGVIVILDWSIFFVSFRIYMESLIDKGVNSSRMKDVLVVVIILSRYCWDVM